MPKVMFEFHWFQFLEIIEFLKYSTFKFFCFKFFFGRLIWRTDKVPISHIPDFTKNHRLVKSCSVISDERNEEYEYCVKNQLDNLKTGRKVNHTESDKKWNYWYKNLKKLTVCPFFKVDPTHTGLNSWNSAAEFNKLKPPDHSWQIFWLIHGQAYSWSRRTPPETLLNSSLKSDVLTSCRARL